jgi:hypothetical protein
LTIDDTPKAENHDERYLYGRFKGFYRGNKYIGFPMDLQLLTCEDLPEAAGCCTTCHEHYVVYKMDLVETRRGLGVVVLRSSQQSVSARLKH